MEAIEKALPAKAFELSRPKLGLPTTPPGTGRPNSAASAYSYGERRRCRPASATAASLQIQERLTPALRGEYQQIVFSRYVKSPAQQKRTRALLTDHYPELLGS